MTAHHFEMWHVTFDGETAQMALLDLHVAPPNTVPRMEALGWRRYRSLGLCEPPEARRIFEDEVSTVVDTERVLQAVRELQLCHCDCGNRFWARAEQCTAALIITDRPCAECGRADDVKRVET